ncbi:hypothetical protein ABIC24_006859 [Methylobacterium radiotolerans]
MPVLRHRDQLGHVVHLHGAVADQRDHRPVRMGDLGGDGVGHRRAHGGEAARERAHLAATHLQVAGVPVGAGAGIRRDDHPLGQARRELPGDALRVHRVGLGHGPILGLLPPGGDALLDAGAPSAAFLLLLQERQQGGEGLGRLAAERHLHRIAQRQHLRGYVDLHAAGLPLLGQELGPGEARADHQQRVAFGHHVGGGLGAEEPDRAGDEGQVVRQRRLAEQRLGHAGLELVGHRDHLVGGVQRARAHEDRDLLAGIEHVGGPAQIGVEGHDPRHRVADAREGVAVLAHRRLVGDVLQVVGQDDRRDLPLGLGDAHGAVDDVADRGRARRLLHVGGDVLVDAREVELLLVMRPVDVARLLAGDGEQGDVVRIGVVHAGEQVRRAGAGRGEAHADLAGELGVGGGHERRHLLVADLDELEGQVVALERAEEPVDPVPGVAEDRLDAPFGEALPEEVGDGVGHGGAPRSRAAARPCGGGRASVPAPGFLTRRAASRPVSRANRRSPGAFLPDARAF